MVPPLPVPDRHVHTEWSWDAAHGDMLASCARAVELGVPAVAFTEHADFIDWVAERISALPAGARVPDNPSRDGSLDVAGYWAAIDRCRARYPQLRIESGVELGEPHLFAAEIARVLGPRRHDRVLGSLHCVEIDGRLTDVSDKKALAPEHASERMRRFLGATLDLVTSGAPFAILAHLDYPKRYWPHDRIAFDELDFEEEYRAVLRALAASGRALEVNSSRALGSPRGPCPGLTGLRWWHQEGGQAISFGSDAHRPEHLASGFAEVAAIAEAAGFRPAADPLALWGR
jgi:histidinol-phosphatase (PHP family)